MIEVVFSAIEDELLRCDSFAITFDEVLDQLAGGKA